ncbi:MAG: tRNA 2-thiouridine(34) synthase MnmA [Planctomycetes bacterium]|nr:tRNA 2-thiouridine(34) synthase MnmA [Planctomycetota bacterium]
MESVPANQGKVVVAMSGGVDSSVAACLLVEQGYEVIGLFMRHGVPAPTAPEGDDGPRGLKPAAQEENGSRGLKPAAKEGDGPRGLESAAGESGGRSRELSSAPPGSAGAVGVQAPAGRTHQGCCSATDAADARFVAGMLGIPFYALNFADDFDRLIDYFADEYARGRTPNPCVHCNDQLKFGRLLEYADAVGAKHVATGHYARVERRQGSSVLLRACDARKDQSYVLFGIGRDVLDRALFPIGHLSKAEVREHAARLGLPNQNKPDSVEICFVPDRDYARVVRQRRPDAFAEGEVVDAGGRVVGRHSGLPNYTVGQRQGLGIALGRPMYVTELGVESNRVTLGDVDDLLRPGLIAERVNYLVDPPGAPFRAEVKIRYLHAAAPATVHPMVPGEAGRHAVRVAFDEPQRAVTPGQAVVFYDGAVVLGGGWIESALPSVPHSAGLSVADAAG